MKLQRIKISQKGSDRRKISNRTRKKREEERENKRREKDGISAKRDKICGIILLIIQSRFLCLFLYAVTPVSFLQFQRRFFGQFLRIPLCRAHICLGVAFRRGNTFISILQQAEADGLVACAAVANECIRAASKNGSRKKPPLKAYIKFDAASPLS